MLINWWKDAKFVSIPKVSSRTQVYINHFQYQVGHGMQDAICMDFVLGLQKN
jgi:hypothetical protein